MKFKDRPLLLSAALLLSTIGSSLAVLLYFSAAVFFNQTSLLIEKLTNMQTMQKITPLYFIIFGALYVLSLLGIIKMRGQQKAGYFFYTGAQVTLLIVPPLWLGANAFSATNTIFTLMFIAIYSIFLKSFNNRPDTHYSGLIL